MGCFKPVLWGITIKRTMIWASQESKYQSELVPKNFLT